MEVPDKTVESVLESISNVLLEAEDLNSDKKLKRLAKSYNKLLKVADSEYEHDFPYFEVNRL